MTVTGGDSWQHDDEMARLGAALGYDASREPPPGRVAAVRAAAEQMRADLGGGPPVRPHEDAVVTRLPLRRQFLVGALAASVGAVAGFGAKAAFEQGAPAGPPSEQIAFAGAPSGVSTDARLIDHEWGTELLLDVSGLADGEVYSVTYTDAAGTAAAGGSFQGVADTMLQCRFNAAFLRDNLATIAVTDSAGVEVLRAELA